MKKYLLTLIGMFVLLSSLFGASYSQTIQEEKDELLMRFTYAQVYKNWQSDNSKSSRGYNIGATLYDNKDDKILLIRRNLTEKCKDKTRHAEVSLMQTCLLNKCKGENKSRYLNNTTIYTTLEPCMMCSGMMVFLKASRVVYGQTDPYYGKTIERLKTDYNDCSGIYCKVNKPNKRSLNLQVEKSKTKERKMLDKLFKIYKNKDITDFLISEYAKRIYKDAYETLLNSRIQHRENLKIFTQIREILRNLDDTVINRCNKTAN